MRSGEARLSIDCGHTSTVAVLAWPDGRWTPLVFDGEARLPSAVLVAPDGEVLTGHRAWQAAVDQPDRFVPAPRQPAGQSVSVSDGEVDRVDLVAAVLRRVAAEAERVAGGPVEDVRLVVPAGWGPRRRTWMRQVAHRAGLPQPRLVEAPVGVAEHLLATGTQLPVGAYITVCDVGDGAEVTVLRRGPAGFEVLATLADPAAGGGGIDQALIETFGTAAGEDGQRWALTASVRAAKESLAQHAAVTVPVPGAPAVVVNSTLLEQAAQPVVRRVAELTMEAIAAAEITVDELAGIYLIGGTAQLPMTARALAEQTSQQPVVLPDPALAPAVGAAGAGAVLAELPGGRVDDQAVVPPVRRAVAIAVPGFASLGMIAQFLSSAIWFGGSLSPWPMPFWGELAMAAVFAVLASLGAGTVLGATLAAGKASTGGRSGSGEVGTGILAAGALGVGIAGMYAVVASLHYRLDVGPFLRWALLPVAPTVAVAAVMALLAARQWRVPRGGWSQLLAFPTSSIVTAAAGMGLMVYSATAARWPSLVLWIDLAGIVGGLLLGIGIVIALVSPLVLRLILGIPVAVVCASIVSWRGIGILGAVYAIAVAVWWVGKLWTHVLRSDTAMPNVR